MQQKHSGFMEKASDFVSGKGFYIILALCAAAIGVSGYVLFFTGGNQEEEDQLLQISSQVDTVPKTPEISQPEEEETLQPEEGTAEIPAPQVQEEEAAPSSLPEEDVPAAQTKAPVAEKFINPVQGGQVLRGFSGDTLIQDETMGDWRVHSGVDIACEDGGQVTAIGDGTVTAVFYDDLTGYCLTLDHGNGVISTLRGLMKNATVEEGDTVKMGDLVGGGGSTMTTESAMAPHIHLEVTRDGAFIDPMTLIEGK